MSYTACADDDYTQGIGYIDIYKQIAIDEMHRTGIPASIKLAQGMLETAYGTSRLCMVGNNHFGIKCKSYWVGDTIKIDDDAAQECFRRYPSSYHSYVDHSHFLMYHRYGHYRHLFDFGKTDYTSWAKGLQKAGYATNKHYAEGLIRMIERYQLYIYDQYGITAINTAPTNTAGIISSSSSSKVSNHPKYPWEAPYNYPDNNNDEVLIATKTIPATTSKARPISPVTLPKKKNPNTTSPRSNAETSDSNNMSSVDPSIIDEKGQEQIYIREVYINGCKAIQANQAVHLPYISQTYDIPLDKIFRYNDTSPSQQFEANTYIYLEAKKKKSINRAVVHTLKPGESLYDVSQKYGIQLSALYKINKLRYGVQPDSGTPIYLNAKVRKRLKRANRS